MHIQQDVLDFNKFISAISLALDLAESCVFKDSNLINTNKKAFSDLDVKNHNFTSHSKKTALIAIHLSSKLGYQGNKLNNLYIAAFLHDIGAVEALSYCHTDLEFVQEHCEFGSNIIKKLPISKCISSFIRFHHENFDGSGPYGLHSIEIPQEAQIIHLADFFELIYDKNIGSSQRELALNWFRAQRSKMFDPYLVDVLLDIAETERFWLDLENIDRDFGVLERIRPKIYTPMDLHQLRDISSVFAAIIDKKSNFTRKHSTELSKNTGSISSLYGFDAQKTERLRIAGLLHDLGKLAVPNHILDKPGKLTREEYSIIKSHTYYTKLILDKIDGIQDISEWASNHHETLRGTGYPDALDDSRLSLESRILAVCDIYQALIEDRPYRQGMHIDKTFKIIDDMVDIGNIDGSVVKKLKDIL
ncbi:MAG: fusion domain and HD-hydrolase domain [Clostridia bacterium]|jgi:HD-GYP domain-containing protein (c-di-GMP phosphodiesterase class II)|nr:fusion domain and HD-hydrolase domain [Clostridia bacterium]